MPDREKVIKGLEHCGQPTECDGCPYDSAMGGCFTNLKSDALELLKEREPRVLTLEDAIETLTQEGGFVWIEQKSHPCEKSKVFPTNHLCDTPSRRYKDYGKEFVPHTYSYRWLWRCWNSFPNNEQREAVKWDD